MAFIEFLQRTSYPAQVRALLPFRLSSPNAIFPAHTLTAFLQEAPALWPEGCCLRLLREDAGFFEEALPGFLEGTGLLVLGGLVAAWA